MKTSLVQSLRRAGAWVALAFLTTAPASYAGGILTPKGSPQQPIQIRSHQVNITLNNGFARTEVLQTFFNPNPADLEAVYSFPLPKTASLSEMTISAGEKEIHGEVIEKKEADRIYEEEKQQGNDTGKAEKKDIQSFDFFVSPVRANAETRVRFVYYQPIEIDTGVGRYVYPLEDGGTDEAGKSFWEPNTKVDGSFSINLELKSAAPIAETRVPGFENSAATEKLADGHYRLKLDRTGTQLDRDFVFYYRLQDNLPGRIEVIPYRADASKPGTFMMVVTPGLDLKPLTGGADYVYVLDKSGSMSGGKIQTLARGVGKALDSMKPQDRFRIITFDTSAQELTHGWQNATPENIRAATENVAQITADGSTNIHEGLSLALQNLDADRATSIVLVTDGVTNTGIIAPAEFQKLLKKNDVRVFGFVMGNSANWPLMDIIGKASGGFSAGVSNDDDIIGQILLAKNKIAYECLHDASIKISGVSVHDTTDGYVGKVYRGQQLVLFGKYDKPGKASVSLQAKLTGADKTYTTTFDFPATDTDNPEIERLWALNQIEQAQQQRILGLLPENETSDLVRNLGIQYQLVTDETSMIVLNDESFLKRGIQRNNQARVAVENTAQALRASQPVKSYQVNPSQPVFSHPAPSLRHSSGGGGGGAMDPLSFLAIAGLVGMGLLARQPSRKS